jgi:hypothetical protein
MPFAARHWKGALLVLSIALVGAVVLLRPDGLAGERRALLRMRPEERLALYAETRRNAEALCTQAQTEAALLDLCFEAASFLAVFPECDEACQAFVRAHRRGPTR